MSTTSTVAIIISVVVAVLLALVVGVLVWRHYHNKPPGSHPNSEDKPVEVDPRNMMDWDPLKTDQEEDILRQNQ